MKKKKSVKNYSALVKKKDLTLSLPVSYKGLFKFTYRTNLTLIFKISIMLSIFAIPFFITTFMKAVITNGIIASTPTDKVVLELMTFQGWFGFVNLFAFLFFALGYCGVIYVMKRHLKNEGVMFLRDFKAGIKKNGLSTIGLTILYLGFLTILNYIMNLFSFKSEISYYSIFLVFFIIISVMVFIMWNNAIMLNMIYTCSFVMLIKSSFLCMVARLPYSLLSLLASFAPLIIVYSIGFVPVLFAFILIYITIGLGNATLVTTIINLYIFDELINKRQFKEAYRQGLFDGEVTHPVDEGFSK